MKLTPEKIDVVIYGERGTGKRTLAATLQGRTYLRHHDKKIFVLNVQLNSDSSTASVGLVTVDTTNFRTFSKPLLHQAMSTTRTAVIALTKVDLISRDYSPDHLTLLLRGPFLAANYDTTSFAISATTGEGVDELISWIANVFSPITIIHSETPRSWWRKVCRSLLDRMAACFALPDRRLVREVDEEISEIADGADIRYLLKGNLATEWDTNLKHRLGAVNAPYDVAIHRVTPSLIVKESSACGPSERASMEYVLKHTMIPVPRVHCPDSPHLVMDYIEGEMLYECWDRLSPFMQFRIACTLRLYVRQLQTLKHECVGALQSGRAGGIFFDEGLYGPFDSVRRFRQFCELVAFEGWQPYVYAARQREAPIPPMPHSSTDWTPVFIHGDLNPSNILLSRDGTLWVVDWGEAGFYPSCIETLVMRHHEVAHEDDYPLSWKRYRHFIAGTATKEEEGFWGYFHTAIHRFRGRTV